MYKQLIRPLLFQLPPETIHHLIMAAMRVLHYIPGGRLLLRMFYTTRHPSLVRKVFGIRFPNPVGLAAGFDKDAEVYEEMASLGFGFVEVGTITPLAQPGNPKPRLFRLPMDHALINRMGFNNQGVASAVHRLHRRNRFYHRRHPVVLGGNLGKNTLTPNEKAPADYLRLFRSLYEYVNYFVINVSCPNVANLSCLQNKEHLKKLLEGLIDFRRGQNHYRPILLKISPDLSDEQIDEMIEVLVENGLDGIVATNTTTSRQGLLTPSDLVAEIGADVGIAHDGDADRVMLVDAHGNEIDGDVVEAVCAIDLKERGLLAGNTAVSTVMCNLGLAHALRDAGIELVQTKVGDRYVLEAMREGGFVLGGEQSGHMIFLEHNSTGDGLVTALQFLAACKRAGKSIADAAAVMTRFPQTLVNVHVKDKHAVDGNAAVAAAVEAAEAELGDSGRVLLRPSGTEPVVRVMVEAESTEICEKYVDQVIGALRKKGHAVS